MPTLPQLPIFPRWGRPGQVVRPLCAMLIVLVTVFSHAIARGADVSVSMTCPPVFAHYSSPAGTEEDAVSFQANAGETEYPAGKALFTNNTSCRTDSESVPVEEPAAEGVPPGAAIAGKRAPDWGGILRDTGVLFAAQVGTIGVIYVMPENASGWSEEDKRDVFPEIEDDKWYLNYLVHPYWGATYYIRGRERGLGKAQSVVYSALLSAMYEFGVECLFENPSIQDLLVTPVAGSLVGAFLFEPWRESIKSKQQLRWYDHAVLVLTDPIGVLSLGFEKLFGIQSTIMVDYSAPHRQNRSAGATDGGRVDVSFKFPLN